MKKTAIMIILCIVATNLISQELARSGETYLKFYKKSIDKLNSMTPKSIGYEPEVAQAERSLNSLKKTDPSYDQSAHRNELQSFKDKLGKNSNPTQGTQNDGAGSAVKPETTSDSPPGNIKNDTKPATKPVTALTEDKEPQRNNENFETELEKFLYKKTDHFENAKSEADISKLVTEVDEFEKGIKAFAATAGDQSSNSSSRITAQDGWKTYSKDDGVIYYAEKNGANETDPIKAKATYYRIKLIKIKWEQMSAIFPKSTILADAAKRSADAFSSLGSPETLAKKANETKAANLANVKMDPATATDPALEAQIKKALGESKIAGGKQVVKINLHNKDWNIKRHEISGVILSRSKNFSAVVKEKDGSCTLIRYTSYKQDYSDGNYGNGYIYMGQSDKILCENVNK